ncbi:MAG TPA: acyltransferase, partial [Polyangiaceae bacterium]|nr:acyltransferase [Polyangiaceae bacterium]
MSGSAASARRIPHLTALDGLRGLGLLGVLLFHADGLLPGGYLGVDLFFVLSGYLITSLLLAEQRATGRVELWAFWVRRCRRLLPALLALMPAVAAYGWFFARPDELAKLRSQALATLGYVANWQAIFEKRSYWGLFAAPAPLEHTWSLSIEEQFYVVWPIVVMLLLRRYSARAVLWLALSLTLGSMAAMLVLFSPADSSRAYLGTDTRMASILAGAAFAVVLAPGATLSARAARFVDPVGAVALAGLAFAWCKLPGTSAFLYRGGFWLCELAVLALIACAVRGEKSLIARAFSSRPLVWLGSISYGVYLWHWPVNVMLSEERSHLHGPLLQLLRIALSLAIALVSYRYLEQPIRRNGLPFGRPHYFVPASVALAALLVAGATYARDGSLPGVGVSMTDARYRVVVFGDSTANSLGWGIRGLHREGVAVELLGKDGCTMLWDRCNSDQWAERARSLRADATLIYLGGAFLHGFGAEGAWRTACYPEWDAKLEGAMSHRLQELVR